MKHNFPFSDLKVLSDSGFFERYEEECKGQPTFRHAYERTAEVYKSIQGWDRFPSYNAFRMALSRYRRNL